MGAESACGYTCAFRSITGAGILRVVESSQEACEAPVSYTHLDVYKRQYQWYVIPAGQGAGEQAPAATAIPGATSDTLRVTSSAQVSGNRYYCVDVYKRQIT